MVIQESGSEAYAPPGGDIDPRRIVVRAVEILYLSCADQSVLGTMPMAVFTFLESFNFSRKTILPLCTNEGSGMGGSERDIRRACTGAEVKKGLSITGSQAVHSKGAVQKWLSANGLM